MGISELVDAECEIIMRDLNLEDNGEIRNLVDFTCTVTLNDVSSWQLDMHTEDFMNLNSGGHTFSLGDGIMFKRDNVQIMTGPVMLTKTHYIANLRTTSIFGGCDNAYLAARVCYPRVEGLVLGTDGCYRFTDKVVAEGMTTTIATTVVIGQPNVIVTDASVFLPGATMTIATAGTVTGTTAVIAAIDYPNNTLIVATNFGRAHPAGTLVTQTNTKGAIVDNPTYLGFDSRSGNAETVMKELVHYNAGDGACVDMFGPRAIPHLAVKTNYGRGGDVVVNSRGENLLAQIQDIAIAGGVYFYVTQNGTDLEFEVYTGADLTDGDLIFSVESGTLKEYEYTLGLPIANMVIGVGPNPGVDKIMLPSADPISIAQYGRFEGWESAATGQASDTPAEINTNMGATNQIALLSEAYNAQLTLTIQETDQIRFPRDFYVGDKVRVMIGDEPIDQVVTNLNYSVPAGSGSAGGSAALAFSKKQQTRVMQKLGMQGDLIRQLMLNAR
jgi:hypothetical protein